MSTTTSLRAVAFACVLSFTDVGAGQSPADAPLMDWSMMQSLTQQHIQALEPKPYPELIVWEDLEPLLEEIRNKGWAMPYAGEVSKRMVKESEFLNTFAQSEAGAKYLQANSGKLLLDRVDRISHAKGGEQALKEVVKLPNSASIKPTRSKSFMPSLKDMLPMKHGKAAGVDDYDKPTNRAYTAEQVLKVMQQLHRAEEFRRAQRGIR